MRRRVIILIITYIAIGLTIAVTQLFGHTGDLPNASAFGAMVGALPDSAIDLLFATIFWIIIPALVWPLLLAFTLLFGLARLGS